jgi:hypothetical protein
LWKKDSRHSLDQLSKMVADLGLINAFDPLEGMPLLVEGTVLYMAARGIDQDAQMTVGSPTPDIAHLSICW